MYVVLNSPYGMPDKKAYFQKVGTGCFQFVWNKNNASVLTSDECSELKQHETFYCKMYGAANMTIEK